MLRLGAGLLATAVLLSSAVAHSVLLEERAVEVPEHQPTVKIVPLYRQADVADETDVGDVTDDPDMTDSGSLTDDESHSNTMFSQCGDSVSSGQGCRVDAYRTCNMTEVGADGCSLANITGHERVNIIPGGNTGCLNSSTEYFFQVMPANPKKLIIWFFGGGACWEDNITMPGACASYEGGPDYTFYVDPNPVTNSNGMFNRTHEDAPFRDFSAVQLPYCSGDLYVGNRTRVYKNDTTGEIITEAHQKGGLNTESVLSWVFDNYPNITKLVVGGCSAGSFGSQLWSAYIHNHYKVTLGDHSPKTVVIADGFAGILPENQRSALASYGSAGGAWASVLPVEYREKIANGTIFFCEATNYFQDMMPNAIFATPQGSYDTWQLEYFNALAAASDKNYAHDASSPWCAAVTVPTYDRASMGPAFYFSGKQLHNVTESMYKSYMNHGADNFVPYIINSTQHCFMSKTNLYDLSVIEVISGRNISLVEWLDDIPLFNEIDDEFNDGVFSEPDDEVDFFRVCDITLPCDPEVFNITVLPYPSGNTGVSSDAAGGPMQGV